MSWLRWLWSRLFRAPAMRRWPEVERPEDEEGWLVVFDDLEGRTVQLVAAACAYNGTLTEIHEKLKPVGLTLGQFQGRYMPEFVIHRLTGPSEDLQCFYQIFSQVINTRDLALVRCCDGLEVVLRRPVLNSIGPTATVASSVVGVPDLAMTDCLHGLYQDASYHATRVNDEVRRLRDEEAALRLHTLPLPIPDEELP